MFKSIQQAINHYLQNNPKVKEGLERSGYGGSENVSVAGLPKEYDATPYRTVINGVYVQTVGEYKAEVAKMEDSWYL